MKKNRNQRPSRKMKPVYLVFCEGETEDSIILTSNPAIELWFLLHNAEQNAAISTDKRK